MENCSLHSLVFFFFGYTLRTLLVLMFSSYYGIIIEKKSMRKSDIYNMDNVIRCLNYSFGNYYKNL